MVSDLVPLGSERWKKKRFMEAKKLVGGRIWNGFDIYNIYVYIYLYMCVFTYRQNQNKIQNTNRLVRLENGNSVPVFKLS